MGFNEVSLGKYVILSTNCMLLDSNLDHEHLIISDKRIHIPNHIRIDDYVWVGAGSIILPGVTIGQRSIIAAGSVVNKSFPEDVLVGGNPAKIIRKLR
ncbi:MAG: acyltransferase [Deltaproteobacteria bacterium]|nr:acyltransferase [Deltaproteobacteria bacterium]